MHLRSNLARGITLLATLALGPLLASAQDTVIKAGKLIDPEAGTTAANQVILIEAGRIKAVGADLKAPPGATVIDLSGSTVLPGLFDCHTHLCSAISKVSGTGANFNATLTTWLSMTVTKTTGYRALEGAAHAREMLEVGFTAVRDVGNAGNYADTDLRRAIENGLVPGPTVLNAGRIITPFGGQYSQLIPERRDIGNPEYLYADTRDELKKAIRENIHYGAKVIKIVVDDQPYVYSVKDIKFIVEEAGAAGLKVAAHAVTQRGARNAVEAGVASIEHGPELTDEDLALMKKKGVTLVGTDFPELLVREGGMPPGWHKVYVDRLRRAHRGGVMIAFGTDVFNAVPGHTRGSLALLYIDSFAEAELPAPEIVKAMTTNAARLLGVERERGAIKPGLAADIIATRENPLDNIQTLKHVTFVMKEGKVFKGGSGR